MLPTPRPEDRAVTGSGEPPTAPAALSAPGPMPTSPWPPPDTPAAHLPGPGSTGHRRRRRLLAGVVALLATTGVVATALVTRDDVASVSSATAAPTAAPLTSAILPSVSSASTSAPLSTSVIYAKVDPAIVDITTTISGGAAAGTGMVLTADGLIMTNNHVIADATSIEVQIAGTGPRYSAHVVGYDVTDDVAIIKLDDASNLSTIAVGDSTKLELGDTVVAIGNALGAAGPHAVTSGTIDALAQTVTADTDIAGSSETLDGLIQSNAALQPGDSGGALVDSSGAVIGMNTIGTVSSGRRAVSSTGDGYAIAIDDALTIAREIVAGQASATVHIGDRAILGINVENGTNGGVTIAEVVNGGPAAAAGMQASDTITAIDGTTITDATDLQAALGRCSPGQQVAVTWSSAGKSTTATVELVAGPPA
jgi:S1-C subfamily serine protease